MQRLFFSILSALAIVCSSGRAEILLTVDVSDPENVVFSATDGVPSEAANVDSLVGFSLLGFLNADSEVAFDGTGDLEANGMDAAYLSFLSLNFSSGPFTSGKDINIYANLDAGAQNFLTSAPAFSGAIAFDLSSIASLLPTAGGSGLIQIGDGSTVGPVIGSYEVVPEPAACLLVGAAGMLLIFRRRSAH
jgi:hypothetical protein